MLAKSSGKSNGFTCHKWIPFPTHLLHISSHTYTPLLYIDFQRQPRCCFCYQTHWFDFKACKAFTFARTALRLCVCSLTKDTYICMHCILQILAGSCLCVWWGLCHVFFYSSFAWLDLNAEISMLHTSRHRHVVCPAFEDICTVSYTSLPGVYLNLYVHVCV